jgi:hypothetical protein
VEAVVSLGRTTFYPQQAYSQPLLGISHQHRSHQFSWRPRLVWQNVSGIVVVDSILDRLLLVFSLVPDERIAVCVPFRKENSTGVNVGRRSSIKITLEFDAAISLDARTV